MEVGDEKTVEIPCEAAYGEHDPEGRQEVPRSQVPDHIPLDLGTVLQIQLPDGRAMPVTVVDVTEDVVVLDGNHALAGKTLIFSFEIIEISEEE
jgi:FKBP-type peptidyl-prolyl cis-trans isomerase 2